MTALCEIRGLSVAYPGASMPALDGIDLDIRAGERLAVIGESGSGKSTLARALAGLLPDGARVEGGMRWAAGSLPRPGRDLGFVFQDPAASLNPVLTIGEQVGEACRGDRRFRSRWRCWRRCGFPIPERWRRPFRTSFPVASASAWRSPPRLPRNPAC